MNITSSNVPVWHTSVTHIYLDKAYIQPPPPPNTSPPPPKQTLSCSGPNVSIVVLADGWISGEAIYVPQKTRTMP